MTDSNAAIATSGLGKRYGKSWALNNCTFSLPRGKIAALVGPNGAGKSTLLRMLAGITTPSTGDVTIDGRVPSDPDGLQRIGYLDQERPLYRHFRVAEMLRFGREFNPGWDDERAHQILDEFGIALSCRVGKLSVGQQAQVAFTMCLAKRPDFLLLDEPVAALDPLARESLMHLLLQSVVDNGTTVVLSSHAVADLGSFCDFLLVLNGSHLSLVDDLDHVLSSHHLLVGPSGNVSIASEGVNVVSSVTTGRQTSLLIRADQPFAVAGWEDHEPVLEEIVIGYLRRYPLASISGQETAYEVGSL